VVIEGHRLSFILHFMLCIVPITKTAAANDDDNDEGDIIGA